MNKSICLGVAVALTLGRALASRADGNLVENGDFEDGTFVDPGGTGDILPDGWILGPPSPSSLSHVNVVDTVSGPLGPESGSDYLRYQSTSSNGSEDCIYQYVSTVVGQEYVLSYYVADTSTSVGNNVEFHAVWDETGAAQFHVYDVGDGPAGYQLFAYGETATLSTTRIDFHGVDTNGSILLDNVSLVPAFVGDANLDGTVNLTDLLTLLNSYDESGDWSQGDFNGDGTVNLTDLLGLLNNYGLSTPDSSAVSSRVIPEPAFAGALAASVLSLMGRWPRRVNCIGKVS